MKKTFVTLLIVAAVLGAAFLTNPGPERHREKIRAAIAERSVLEKILGVGVLTAFASNYRSLGVASYTVVNGRVISVGAFGVVVLVQ